MSLWLYDPMRLATSSHQPSRRYTAPFQEMERSLDHFFNGATQELQLRDHAGQLTNDDKGFRYRVDCRGFSPEELKVDVEGDALVIRADHKSEKEDEMVHRSFYRSVAIPKDVKKEAIKCDIDDGGRLVVFAPKAAISDADKRSIPIEFKKAEGK